MLRRFVPKAVGRLVATATRAARQGDRPAVPCAFSWRSNGSSRVMRAAYLSTSSTPKIGRFRSIWLTSVVCSVGVGVGAVVLYPNLIGRSRNYASSEQTTLASTQALQAVHEHPDHNNPPAVYRIVLTGGPCGGKTTALTQLSSFFSTRGFNVYVVPEALTLLHTGGANPHSLTTHQQEVVFEESLMKTRMAMEDAFYSIAKSTGKNCLIICDRGAMDSSVYLSKKAWALMLDMNDWTVLALRDRRYDAVIHLVTTAIGAETFYTKANNPARVENLEQARQLDIKVLNAWVGHPHLRIVDNSTDFKGKIQRVTECICKIVGVPIPAETERRFVLRSFEAPLPIYHEEFAQEDTYLRTSDGSVAKVIRRGQHGTYAYVHMVTKKIPAGARGEVTRERQISGQEYVALLAQADPDMPIINKTVRCFMWENHYFQLVAYPDQSLVILETQADSVNKPIALPPFLTCEREVTGEKSFSHYMIAKQQSANSKAN